MSERDELAELIRDTDLLGCGCCGASTEVQVGPDEWDVDYPAREEALAIKLLDAGYRKPRTITTVEALDAMPDDSVVLDSMDGPLTKVGRWWHSPSNEFESSAVLFPTEVLYEGKP